MRLLNSTSPIATMQTVRPDVWRGLTSVGPGVVNPLAYIPVLREDRVRGRITVQVKSEETVKVIVNPVRVRVEAHLIPKTVLARFAGSIEVLNRSYQNEAAPVGMGETPKWFLASPPLPAGDKGHAIFDTMGIHWRDGAVYNTDLVESYNQLVNWQRKEVSPALPMQGLHETDLAQAMWDAWRFDHVKPSFDSKQMEGAIELSLQGTMPVEGYTAGPANAAASAASIQGLTDRISVYGTNAAVQLEVPDAATGKGLRVNLAESSGVMTLANLELARKTSAFAAMRDRYKGVPEEYLIDLLMAGIRLPPEQLRQPILLARSEAVIGQTERYATDGTSLDVSVANGMASVSMTINTPSVNTGGLILVTCTIVPEQLFERVADPALFYETGQITDVGTPEYLKDYLDPQKVEVVKNEYVDLRHATPDGVFGYAPLNYGWRRSYARVGGKYKRPVPDAFSEDRQRIWSIEKDNPTLSADWYLCPSPFPKSVFADTDADPYEVITVVECSIVGSTVFGPYFEEDMDSWDKVIAQVDQSRISSEPAGTLVADEAEVVETTQEGGEA